MTLQPGLIYAIAIRLNGNWALYGFMNYKHDPGKKGNSAVAV